MILIELKQYLQNTKAASLSELVQRFNTEPALLRDMLGHWIRKGRVRQCAKTPSCGSKCQKCSVLVTELYEWV